MTEDTDISISKNLTIDLNGHHLNGMSSTRKIFTIEVGKMLHLIGGRTNDAGSWEVSEIDGTVENFGVLKIADSMTFKDKIIHRGERLFITGNHGDLRISLAKGKYIEADADMAADSVRVHLLDAADRAALNDRYHDHEDILICQGGTTALESVFSTPEIDNPFVSCVYKADGPSGAGVYLVDRIASGIFLDGVNGNDSAAGTESAPVKTFAKAKELLEKQIASGPCPDGIYVMGTVTVDGTENWSMPENTAMIRHENLRSALVYVSGRLTITDMVIDGLSEGGVTAVSALLDVDDGTLTLGKGAVLRNNINTTTVTLSSVGNAAGGVHARNEALIILDGGTVTGNEAGLGGGIGLYSGSKLTMSSGSITGNRALMKYHFGESRPAGGGVMVAGSSRMNLNGGLISRNLSEYYGGGISLGGFTFAAISTDKDKKGSLNMTGGTVDGNIASANGGGIYVQANTEAVISAGSITNNKALGSGNAPFAGGGIYVNSNARGVVFFLYWQRIKNVADGNRRTENVLTYGEVFPSVGALTKIF